MKVLLTATVQSHIAQFHKPLIGLLKEKGYEVHVAAKNNLFEKDGLEIENVDEVFDIPFERSPFKINNVIAYKKLKLLIMKNKYDIIHCNTPVGGVITKLAAKEARKNGTQVFYTAHGFHFYSGASVFNWLLYYPLEKIMAGFTDKLITITKEDYDRVKNSFNTNVYYMHGVGANEKKYYPVSLEDSSKIRSELSYSKRSFILVCAGELNKNKNQRTLIRAISISVKKIPDILLLIAGNGSDENELKTMVKNLKIEKNVVFLGYKTDLDKYMKICDVLVSASYREGLPLNIIEAMLCCKPVIASQNRGHRELVEDRKTGLLSNANTPLRFAELILELYLHAEKREIYGKNGMKKSELFTTKNIIKELTTIYQLKGKKYG